MTGRRPPLAARELRELTQPRRALGRQAAAAYLDLSPRTFAKLVKAGLAPLPRLIELPGGRVVEKWTVDSLDEYLDALPLRGGPRPVAPPRRRLFSL